MCMYVCVRVCACMVKNRQKSVNTVAEYVGSLDCLKNQNTK